MNKTWVIFSHELLKVIKSRSFLLTLILIPVVSLIVFFVVGLVQRNNPNPGIGQIFTPPTPEINLRGLVDQSGIVKSIPSDLTSQLKIFSDTDSAETAFRDKEINSYYIIQPDYLATGAVEYVTADFNPLSGSDQTNIVQQTIQENLLANQPEILTRLNHLVVLETRVLSEAPQRDPGSMLTFFLPYIVTFLFYMLILGTASMMLNSITTEKENRAMETLLTSVTPLQMLTGKIFALGCVGLFQTIVWSSFGLVMLRLSGNVYSIGAEFQLPLSVLIWGIVFFLLGYTVYSSLMAGLGALVPNLREASQATFIIILPLIIPLMFITALIESPNSALSIGMSLFPLTAPVAMMTRLAGTEVPFWQPLLAAVLLVLTAVLIIRAVAGMFRAQTLLSGQPFSLKLFLRSLTGKA